MAHVKVVRRSMDKKEWIAIRIKWLKEKCTAADSPLSGWTIREARQTDEMTYSYDGEARSISSGEMYFSPDGTAFLSLTAEIPQEWDGQEVWFHFETAAEMIAKVNGSWTGGLDPNRKKMRIRKAEDSFRAVQIEMEGYNRSKPDDERNPESAHLRGCRQVFDSGSFQLPDRAVSAAYYDAKILLETLECEYISQDIRDKIEKELHKALLLIPFDAMEEIPRLHKGIEDFRKHLESTVFHPRNSFHIGKVALVAHSHLDIAYYWRRIHTVQKNARTCLIQLDLMDQYPDFKYAHTQAYTFETLEKNFPDIFQRVKQRVREGRFEPAGGMYIEPDCNIPTAESLIRQCLYGQHYFQDTFGITVNNCWLPDVFGNTWILPQILRKSGMEYFVSNKMSTWNDTNLFPHNNFLWKGIDGTDILACVPPTHFISWNTPEQIIENWEAFQDKQACPETLNMFGYGDGGSGVTEEMLEFMERLNKIPSLPEVRHTRGDEFLTESITREQDLSEWDGELYLEMHRGTFTTKGYLKKWNRRFELMLRNTEYFWTLAYLETGFYPQEELDHIWKLLLINQFHDILPGTHIAPVEKDAKKDYDFIRRHLRLLLDQAFQHLSGQSGIPVRDKDGRTPLQLINTLGWGREECCFIPETLLSKTDEKFSFTTADCPSQEGEHRGEKGIWLSLPEIAPFDLTIVEISRTDKAPAFEKWYHWDERILETPHYSVEWDASGSITRLYSKKFRKELTAENGSIGDLKIYHDYPGMYDAWDILENYKDKQDALTADGSWEIQEEGPLFLILALRQTTGASTWERTIRFYKEKERIDFDFDVDWHEQNRLAKLEFNLNILSRQAGCDTSAGTIYRDTHKNTSWQQARFEVCMHKYVDLYEPGLGVALINDSKYGVSLDKNQIGISLLRGTIRPDNESDMGHHRFSFSLHPHDIPLEESGLIEKAWAFNVPLMVNAEHPLPRTATSLISPPNLHVQSIKKAQRTKDQKRIVIRLTELKGRRGETTIDLNRPFRGVQELNMLEEEIQEGENGLIKNNSGSRITLRFKPFEIITLGIDF